MITMDKTALITTACKDLLTYGVWDGTTKLKYMIKKMLKRPGTAAEDLIFWPTGLLAHGLWQCREEKETEVQVREALAAYFARWQKRGMPVCYLDDLLYGETLLDSYLSEDTDRSKEKYREAVDKMADYAMQYPVDETGSFPYRVFLKKDYVFVDSIGLACPFLYRYGMIFDKQQYMELAVKQIVNFLAYGMDTATGLPYHGYDATDGCKYGIIGWGRAAGWLLRGMSACLQSEYGRERLLQPYQELCNAVLAYQRKDGYFSWQLQAVDGPADTSATGMICATLQEGIEQGILTEDKYQQALQAGRNAIERAVNNGRVYQCSGECLDFSQYPQRYGAYPWSLGPALEVL